MERGVILLLAALMIYVTPAVHGTSHLSFSNDTEVNITRDGCGTSKLCIETPDNCDPAGNVAVVCLFASLKATVQAAPNGVDLMMELRGTSSGYIAVGLTADPLMGITLLFACAQNNNTFVFVTAKMNNTDKTIANTEKMVNEIRGSVNGTLIKCQFNVPAVNASQTRTADSTFNVLVGSGSLSGSALGAFTTSLDSGSLNIAEPNATAAPTVTTTVAPTTISATTASCGAVHPHAVLLLLSVLSLFVMLGA